MLIAALVGVICLMHYRRCRTTYFFTLMPDGDLLPLDLCDITFFEVDEAISSLT